MEINNIYNKLSALKGQKAKILLLLVGIALLFCILERHGQVVFAHLQGQLGSLQALYYEYPLFSAFSFIALYSILIAFFIPVAASLSLLAGAIFGLEVGILLVSVANTLASTGNFLLSRLVLYERVRQKYQKEMKKIEKKISQHGWMYLMLLRLTPFLPAVVINLVVGALPFPLRTFIWVTFFFSIPIVTFYVLLGTRLGQGLVRIAL